MPSGLGSGTICRAQLAGPPLWLGGGVCADLNPLVLCLGAPPRAGGFFRPSRGPLPPPGDPSSGRCSRTGQSWGRSAVMSLQGDPEQMRVCPQLFPNALHPQDGSPGPAGRQLCVPDRREAGRQLTTVPPRRELDLCSFKRWNSLFTALVIICWSQAEEKTKTS